MVLVLGGLAIGEPAANSAAQAAQPAPVVVLDPGHGGENAGAPGAVAGVYEKQVTLNLSRLVRDRLVDRGVTVVMTRNSDRYLTLRQRTQVANHHRAELLVSVHVNASKAHNQKGFGTFILNPRGLDVDSRSLRLDDGANRPGVDPQLARLLDDVERGAALPVSASFAARMQKHLTKKRGAQLARGVKQDSMHVLIGATMPAVLVEVGFIDHAVEGRELLEDKVQAGIATALADAIVEQLEAQRR